MIKFILKKNFSQGAVSNEDKLLADIAERRARLFPDYQRIPARKPKIFVGISFLISMWAIGQYWKGLTFKRMQAKMTLYQYQTPQTVVGAINDLQAINLEKRNFLILSDLFKSKGGPQYVKKLLYKRFNNDLVFVSNITFATFVHHGLGRHSNSGVSSIAGRYFPSSPGLI